MIDRRGFVRVAAGCLVSPLVLVGCDSATPRRIGFLSVGGPFSDEDKEQFWAPLRERGWIVGKNIMVEYRFANLQPERMPALAEELVRLEPALIVAGGTSAAEALKRATTSIPIVIASSTDPVALGLVTNLARPGGNLTGYSTALADVAAKRAQFAHQALPGAKRVALLVPRTSPPSRLNEFIFGQSEAAYRSLGVETLRVEVAPPWSDGDFKDGLDEALRREVHAVEFLVGGPKGPMIDAANAHRVPLIVQTREDVEAGGLLTLQASNDDRLRRVAAIIDKILRGAKPADIPIEQPTRFTLVVNMKAAKALGLDIPQAVVLRADEVIR